MKTVCNFLHLYEYQAEIVSSLINKKFSNFSKKNCTLQYLELMGEIHIIQIEIKNKKLAFVLEFLKLISFIKKVKVIQSSEIGTQVEEDFIVPKAHKEMILSRQKNTARKDYLPISTLDDEIRLSK